MRRKKKLMPIALSLLAVLVISSTGLAHDSWVQPNVAVAEVGEQVYLDLILGNHSNHHRSYRIAGKWDLNSTTLKIYEPSGVISDYWGHAYVDATFPNWSFSKKRGPPGRGTPPRPNSRGLQRGCGGLCGGCSIAWIECAAGRVLSLCSAV